MTAEPMSRGDVLRRVLKLMTVHTEDYRPQAYRIWFDYVNGADPALVAVLDPVVAAGQRLSVAECDRIHVRYCQPLAGAAAEAEGRRDASGFVAWQRERDDRRALLAVITATHAILGDARSSNDRFTGHLTEFSEGLDRFAAIPMLEQCVRLMTEQTLAARQELGAMQARLGENEGKVRRLSEELARVRSEINVDPLSGLANRRRFDQAIDDLFGRGDEAAATLLLIDIDGFKGINDRHGHAVGDAVIRMVSDAIRTAVRSHDLAARFGGDEFAVVLADGDPRAGSTVGEYVRRVVERARVDGIDGQPIDGVSVSVGIAACRAGDTPARFFERADQALYRAKRNGRNRVESG